MKAMALTGIRKMGLIDRPRPAVRKDADVLLKMAMVGVCGSDIHYYLDGRIGSQVVQYPFTVGHECAGVVAKVGKAVRNLEVGQQVVVEPAMACHRCDRCREGRQNTCRKLRFLGCPGQAEGCMAEYIVMPQECCLPADRLTLEQCVLCEPFAIGLYAVKRSGISVGKTAAILGAGPIGLSCMAAAQRIGITDISLTEPVAGRAEIALRAGAKWVGNPKKTAVVEGILGQEPAGVDVVFECVGKQETVDQAIEMLKPGGRLMMIGIPRKDRISFRIDLARRKEISLFNVRRQNHCTERAIELLAGGKVNIDYMVTHHFRMEESRKAFEMVAGYKDGVVKAMIEF